MKLPHKVRIKSKVSYSVVWSDKVSDNDDLRGLCEMDKRQITILHGMSDTETIKTLIHEVFHAMEFEYQLEIKHKTVHALEEAVLKLLKLNKWID